MESPVVLTSFKNYTSSLSHIRERTGLFSIGNRMRSNFVSYFPFTHSFWLSKGTSFTMLASCLKASDVFSNSDGTFDIDGSFTKRYNGSHRGLTFPDAFQSLFQEICDETEIAELKLKIGEFEVHLKRNIVGTNVESPLTSSAITTPDPVRPTSSILSLEPSGNTNPFINTCFGKTTKLAALEASGITEYATITSTMVGSFKSSRPSKGNEEQPPIFTEGDIIRKGEVVGYVVQFGNLNAVKADVSGEVLEVLVQEGDAVGYGDPILAVLPSGKTR